LKCDFVISAFGSTAQTTELVEALKPLQLNPKSGSAELNLDTNQSNTPWVFAGGDIIGNGKTVEASNDVKITIIIHHHNVNYREKQRVGIFTNIFKKVMEFKLKKLQIYQTFSQTLI
jgi:pyruvate/2-oxoglutarate dehydrogenase complex dihydrolipoamide dehydrogenase (E3) component